MLGFHVPVGQSVQPRSFVAVGVSETNVPAGQFDHAVSGRERESKDQKDVGQMGWVLDELRMRASSRGLVVSTARQMAMMSSRSQQSDSGHTVS